MNITQGSNSAIVVKFDVAISDYQKVECGLYHTVPNGNVTTLKEWTKSDITFDDTTATMELPITQAESIEFTKGSCVLEIKGLDSDGETMMFDPIYGVVDERHNKKEM